MTREEFIEAYCARSHITWSELRQRREAVPCACGDETCEGWAMVSPDAVEDYARLYGPSDSATEGR